MHLLDAAAKLQENEAQDYSAWHFFYSAILKSCTSVPSSIRLLFDAVSTRRIHEEDDAKVIYHSFMFLSDIFSRHHSDPRFCQVAASFSKARQCTLSHLGSVAGPHQVFDRLWSLGKSPQIDNPFCLNNVAKRVLSVYPHGEGDTQIEINRASASIQSELGLKFCDSIVSCMDSSHIPETIQSFVSRVQQRFSTSCVKQDLEDLIMKLDEILDKTDSGAQSAFLEIAAKALAISVPLKLSISTDRLLIRLAKFKQRQSNIAEALILLDEIEGVVCSNCSYSDVGRFHSTRAECLLSLHSRIPEYSDDSITVLCDALKCLQHAIAAFDRAFSTEKLLQSVLTAAVISNQLEQNGMCNFYSVKYYQISAGTTSSSFKTRFFPAEGKELGQPQIPLELAQSPRQGKNERPASPLSPFGKGRGLQTLISWKISSGN